MSATVLLGPKTRLGSEVVARLRGGGPLLAVARDHTDAAEVAGLPGLSAAAVLDGSLGTLAERVAQLGSGPVRLVVAALGPVHPGPPQTSQDAAGVSRDLAIIAEVLASGRPVEVVLVSTVLAIAPGEDRRYYGGWKALVEQQLQHLVDERTAAGGTATLSVLYPGRLLADADRKGRLRLHTSYARLADIALSSTVGRPVGRVVGWDSRFLLMTRSISLAFQSLRPLTARTLASDHRPSRREPRGRRTNG